MDNNEMKNENESFGNVNISEEVIAVITATATSEISGISGLIGASGGLAEFLGKKNTTKGIKVTLNDNKANIDIFITVSYGVKVPDIASTLQEKVKTNVELMTGIDVDCVNVYVQGINTLPPEEEPEK